MSTQELKPCPHCGGVAEIYNPFHLLGQPNKPARYRGGVRCTVCGCESSATTPPDEAIAKWNRRAQPQEALDKLPPKTCVSELATRTILYTDTIEGEQVCRDDMWAITTGELNRMEGARLRLQLLEERAAPSQQEGEGKAVASMRVSGLKVHLAEQPEAAKLPDGVYELYTAPATSSQVRNAALEDLAQHLEELKIKPTKKTYGPGQIDYELDGAARRIRSLISQPSAGGGDE